MSFWTTKLLWSATSLKLKRPLDVKQPRSVTHPYDMSHLLQVPTAYRTYPSRILAGLLDGSRVCCVATPTFSIITLTRRTGNSLNDRVRGIEAPFEPCHMLVAQFR